MPVLYANISHGNEPYILAASVGVSSGEIVIPEVYPGWQQHTLRRWIPQDLWNKVYLDREGGDILDAVLFRTNYNDYVRRVATQQKNVGDSLAQHLKDFEAISLAGKRKRFRNPEIELNVGSPISTPIPRSFYLYPGLLSEYAENCPVSVEGIQEFARIAKENETRQEMVFISTINSFSYTSREPVEKEVPTPPLKRKGYHNSPIHEGIFASLPGSMILADELINAAKRADIEVYHLPENKELPGREVRTHNVIFNPNIKAVLARAGWGTLWLCQVAEKPIITPARRDTDDPEVYHNNQTVDALGLGVVYEEFSPKVIQEASTKVDKINQLNRILFERFGTLDGISFVQGRIERVL